MISDIRSGISTDQEEIIDFMLMAGEGIFEQIFQFPVPGLVLLAASCRHGFSMHGASWNGPHSRALGCLSE